MCVLPGSEWKLKIPRNWAATRESYREMVIQPIFEYHRYGTQNMVGCDELFENTGWTPNPGSVVSKAFQVISELYLEGRMRYYGC